MNPAAYDNRFLPVFCAHLQQRGLPNFPDPKWHAALRQADAEQSCATPRKTVVIGAALWNDESSRFCGIPEPHIDDGTRKWCALFDAATERFWRRRYGQA